MSLHAFSVPKRVALALACGLTVAALLGASLYLAFAGRGQPGWGSGRARAAGAWAASGRSPQDMRAEPKSDQAERQLEYPLTELEGYKGAGAPETTKSLAQDRSRNNEGNDDELFAALEQLERRMAAGMARARESVVSLEYTAAEGAPGSRRIATGVVINSRGDVLSVRIDPPSSPSSAASAKRVSSTAGSDVRSGAGIVARDAAGRRHLASWIAVDPESGITLLRIAPRAVRPIEMAATEATLGSQVFVVGNPFGLGHSVSRGHIAGLDRALKLGSRQLGGLIQVQAPLYPGDSGAVVANLRGQLLGMIRSGLAVPTPGAGQGAGENDFGFAITVRDLLWVADQLRARGRVDRAYLGVRLEPVVEPVTPHQQPESATPPAQGVDPIEGALLQEVLAGTPAAAAGLLPGDAIIGLDGQPIRSAHDLTDWLDRLPAQLTIRLDVLRGRGPSAKRFSLALQTAGRPELTSPASSSPSGSLPGQAGLSGSGSEPRPVRPSLTVVPTSAGASPSDSHTQPGVDPRATAPAPKPTTTATTSRDPKLVQSPLQAAVPQPQPQDLKLTLPQAVTDRLDQLERRLGKLEHPSPSSPRAQPTSSTRTP